MLVKPQPTVNILTSDFETNGVKGYTTYKGTVSDIPLNEGYTTALYTSIVSSSVSPLVGRNSGLISKTGNDAKGEGVYKEFTIDEGFRGSQIELNFLYKTSSDYVDGDIGIYIFDMDSSVLLYPSIVSLPKVSVNSLFQCAFSVNSTSTNYRLYFHIKSTNSLAYQVRIDEVKIQPFSYPIGAVISEWANYTPTFTGFGTATNISFQWRRVGSNAQIRGYWTCGTSTAVEARATLPNSLISNSNLPTLGIAGSFLRSVADGRVHSVLIEPNIGYMTFSNTDGTYAGLAKRNGDAIAVSGNNLSLHAEVPISTWTSNINLVSDITEYVFNTQATPDTNDTTSFGYGAGGAAILSHTVATYLDVQFVNPVNPTDALILEVRSKIDGAWVPIYLAEVPSLFATLARITFGYDATAFYACGASVARITSGKYRVYFMPRVSGGANYTFGGGGALRTWSSITAAVDGFDRWRVRKIANGNMAEVPTTVRAEYYNQTTTSAASPLNYSTKTEDTHNAVTTGASWKFIAPFSGVYLITTVVTSSTTSSGRIACYKNNVLKDYIGATGYTSGAITVSTATIRLNIGDYIDIRSVDYGITANVNNTISITRIGS